MHALQSSAGQLSDIETTTNTVACQQKIIPADVVRVQYARHLLTATYRSRNDPFELLLSMQCMICSTNKARGACCHDYLAKGSVV
jgi:hypothetical protein